MNTNIIMRVYLCILFLLTFSISSCKKSEIPEFNKAYASVRFPIKSHDNKEPEGYNDGDKMFVVSHSFVATPDSPYTHVDIPVMLVGPTEDRDRTIPVEVLKDETSATAKEYEIVSAIIKSKEYQGKIRVKLINTPRLKEEDLKIRLKLGSNDFFSGSVRNFGDAVVYFGTKVPTPTYIEHIYTYNKLIKGDDNAYSTSLEYYSPEAMKVIVKALGWTDWDSKEKHGNDYNSDKYGKYKYLPRYGYISENNRALAIVKILNEYIQEYNKKHPNAPLVHDAGKLKGKKIEARI
ncbi:hypothetical protein IX332_001181 [Porphyromonas levii]|uniref:DUF4843 domain-containing protein n=1 Tax=Porphyromonas levii TaxID=28114 RepID=UPI001B8B8B79|nr:DUF4843 domain-containing protein [Porphyromonas levii]MBR8729857.1 hypothetical protein [Porphyromonas levii]MBR8731712.1 hypothetical protein [Porphyromonas levii]MBR8764488.1 hypothetical protein [Porphyromonas levii]MBR8770028.1 hypothetical protein [Porphyromonas levii]MBR8785225.1 hypothetical protein [Porphyromonas levii]